MPKAARVFLPNGDIKDFVIGKDVRNLFTDREDRSTLVVLQEDGISTFTGFPFILDKEYKEKE